MHSLFSCISISTTLLLANGAALAAATAPSTGHGSETIYGLSNAKHFKSPSNGEFYIQVGSFNSEKNADNYRVHLIKKFHRPVTVKTRKGYHVVLIGPMHTAAEVRAFNSSEVETVSIKKEVPKSVLKQDQNYQYPHDKDDMAVDIVSVNAPRHLEVIGALGVANLSMDDGYLSVTSNETDKLVQTNNNDWNNFTGQLGIGYVYYFPGAQQYSENVQWLPSIEPELNGYFLAKSNIKGDVWRFADPNFNEMTYKMSIQSTRLMFDTALTLVSKKQYSIYGIGGIGNAWNRVGYRDTDRNGVPCPDQYLRLNSITHSNFAWEAGAGLSYAFNDRFSLSLEYLYTGLGKIKTASNGNTGTITAPVIVPADINLATQSGLLGLHVAL